jgi:uncharacterized circularly permuted ATP-grasp superfamily protein
VRIVTRIESALPATQPALDGLFRGYSLGSAYGEMFDRDRGPRPHYPALHRRLMGLSSDEFRRRKAMTDLSMLQDGVGFTVYRQENGIERVWPMDPVPRIIPAAEWDHIERGLVQRLTALNLFLKDVYHDQLILRDRVIDPRLVCEGAFFRREFMGVTVPLVLVVRSRTVANVDSIGFVVRRCIQCRDGTS